MPDFIETGLKRRRILFYLKWLPIHSVCPIQCRIDSKLNRFANRFKYFESEFLIFKVSNEFNLNLKFYFSKLNQLFDFSWLLHFSQNFTQEPTLFHSLRDSSEYKAQPSLFSFFLHWKLERRKLELALGSLFFPFYHPFKTTIFSRSITTFLTVKWN